MANRGNGITVSFSDGVGLIRNHHKAIFENLASMDLLERAYVDTSDKLADFEARISVLENA